MTAMIFWPSHRPVKEPLSPFSLAMARSGMVVSCGINPLEVRNTCPSASSAISSIRSLYSKSCTSSYSRALKSLPASAAALSRRALTAAARVRMYWEALL